MIYTFYSYLFEELEIPYVPKYAFNEIIAVNQEKNSYQYSPELRQTYRELVQVLAMFASEGSIIREKSESLPIRKGIEKTETDKAYEMHRRKVLYEIISKYLNSDEMKKISFFLLGPGEYDRLIGNTHGEKAVSFLEKLDFQDKINELVLYLQEFNLEIWLSELGEKYSEK
ncbi:MAG: iron-containing alcohol dehydrogenase family protein [Desulfobacterales bacterium]|nr:iron-containing alcohol dehydrogenase family protein [Desulfobacterales bacterium]